MLARRHNAALRLELAAVGAIPIVCLALSVLEVVPLHTSAPAMLTAGILAVMTAMILAPDLGRKALRGFAAGLCAVIVYDSTRIPFVVIGGWPDFIPEIGNWLLDTSGVHWSVGYTWRYLGNGAGMGMTYAILAPYIQRWVDRRLSAVAYGVAIWTGLVLTLLTAPNGQDKLFQLTPLTIAVSLTGHLVYGTVLGLLVHETESSSGLGMQKWSPSHTWPRTPL